MQAYSDQKRESDPYSLPDVEVWFHKHQRLEDCANDIVRFEICEECTKDDDGDCLGTGWYWWTCSPGCMPDGDAHGPFATEAEALADAQSEAE